MRSKRLLSLLEQLRTRRQPVSAHTLSDILEVSVRTIYRDILTLQEMGVPVSGIPHVGYQIDKGTFLPPLHFSPEELDALLIGIRLVQSRADTSLGEAAVRALGKISAVLPANDTHPMQESPFLVCMTTSEMSLSGDRLMELSQAIREKRRTEIRYLDLKGKTTCRVVWPLGLTCFDAVWLLSAWCEKRDAFRDFRVDRIHVIQSLNERFTAKKGQRFKDYLKQL